MLRAARYIIIGLLFTFGKISYSDEQAMVSQWVPFELKGNHIYIQVEINGVMTEAILDTGANRSVLSGKIAEELSVKRSRQSIKVHGVTGSKKRFLSKETSVALPNVFKSDVKFVLMPDDSTYPPILGMDFLGAPVIQIDYPNLQLRIASSNAFRYPEKLAIPLQVSGSSIFFKSSIDGFELKTLLDTGNASRTFLTHNLIKDASWYSKVKEWPIESTNNSGLHEEHLAYQYGKTNNFQIGPYSLENVELHLLSDKDVNTKDYLVVGYDVLKHFTITIDRDKKNLYLTLPE